jgi:hypothetical protein
MSYSPLMDEEGVCLRSDQRISDGANRAESIHSFCAPRRGMNPFLFYTRYENALSPLRGFGNAVRAENGSEKGEFR